MAAMMKAMNNAGSNTPASFSCSSFDMVRISLGIAVAMSIIILRAVFVLLVVVLLSLLVIINKIEYIPIEKIPA